MSDINLEPGEVICDKCNGSGMVENKYSDQYLFCPKCYGEKKLTWTEAIFGKETDNWNGTSWASWSTSSPINYSKSKGVPSMWMATTPILNQAMSKLPKYSTITAIDDNIVPKIDDLDLKKKAGNIIRKMLTKIKGI